MSKLNFDITVNNSDFIEKLEQIRSAVRITAKEVEKQGQKVSLSFQQIADNVTLTTSTVGNVIRSMHKQINDAIKSLSKLDSENQARLANLRNGIEKYSENGTNDNQGQNLSIGKEVNSRENLSVDINNQYTELVHLNTELLSYQQKLEAVQNELSALSTEMSSVHGEMEEMRNTGQQNTEAYAALKEKADSLSDAMKNVNADATFGGVISGLEGLSGAFSTASSMLGLFSIENETLQKIMQKVQTAIALTNGLQQVHTVLSKESAFQLNIVGKLKMWWRTITLQAAAAQGIETVAASTGTVVNLGLAGSFRAIGLAIKSIPIFGWILAAISTLIGFYALWSSQTKKQQEEQERLNESVKEFNAAIQNYAAKPVAMIELLSTKFKALGDDMDAQKKFIVDNKKAFDELGVSINSVKDAQQLLIDNKDKFVNAQIAKAVSLVYANEMQEEAKKYVEAKNAAEYWRKEVDKESLNNTEVIQGVPIKIGKKASTREEYDLLQAQGMLGDDGYLLTPSEVKARANDKKVKESYSKMMLNGQKSLLSSEEADEIMNGLGLNKQKSPLKKGNDTKDIEEVHKKYMKLIEQQTVEKIRFAEDSEIRIQQAEIEALADGPEKKFRQLELNQEKERQALDREIKELKRQRIEKEKAIFDANEDIRIADDSEYIRKEFDVSSVNVDDLDKEFIGRYKNLTTKQANELRAYYESERQAMDEYLKDYKTFMEKRRAIENLGLQRKEGKSDKEKQVIDEETAKSLSELDIKAAESSSGFGQLFSDVKERTVKDMRTIVDKAKEALDFIKNGNWDAAEGAKFGISQESFDALKSSSPEIEKIEKSIEDLNKQADSSDTSLNKMSIGFEHLFEANNDPEKLKTALSEIGDSLNAAMQSTKFFSDALSSLGDAFGNDTLSGVAEGMNVAMDAAGAAMSGAQAGAMFGPWGAAAGAAIGLVSSLGSSLAKLHDAKNEKNIQRIQEQIEVLEKSYENLGDSLDKAFSTDASELIEQQNTLLEQQKVLIRNQIAEEKDKKKTDWGRIDEWEQQIEDIDKVIAGNKEKAIDVIFGEDLKSAIDDFAQAYADAWSTGDDKAKSSKDLVKNMIKQMITEAIKAASSEPMEKLRAKLAGFFSDKMISDWERQQIEKDAQAIMDDLDRQFGWADEYMKGDEKESSSQESTKGGFTAMSQETGDELNGRFTALQISNEEIKNSMFFILGNLSSLCTNTSTGNILLTEMRNLAVMSNGHLEDIAKYTKVLLEFGEKLDNIAYNTKSLTTK